MPYNKFEQNTPSETPKHVLGQRGAIPSYSCSDCGEVILLTGYELALWHAFTKVGTNDFEQRLENSTELILDYATEYKINYEDLFYGGHKAKGKRYFSTPMRGLRKALSKPVLNPKGQN